MLLTKKGDLLTCGGNTDGQLGLGDTRDRDTFNLVNLNGILKEDETIIDVEAGTIASLLLTNKGQVLVCGLSKYQCFGLKMPVEHKIFTSVDLSGVLQNEETIVAMAAGWCYSLLLTDKGQVLASGDFGCERRRMFSLVDLRRDLKNGEIIVAMAAGCMHSLLLTNKGQVLTYGSLFEEQHGCENGEGLNIFRLICFGATLIGDETIVAVSAGEYSSLLLTDRGRVLVHGNCFEFKNEEMISKFLVVDLSKILEDGESIVAIKKSNGALLLTDKGRVITCGNDYFARDKNNLFTVLNVDFLSPK